MENKISNLTNEINAILPQTQCRRCGYPSCIAYAEAIANNTANINQCPPGGNDGIEKLATIMNMAPIPLNAANGTIQPRTLAVIDESSCIGCVLCIKACPVDAIIGSNKMLHTVLANNCTGCDLCVAACPVDCISLIIDPEQEWSQARRDTAQASFNAKQERLAVANSKMNDLSMTITNRNYSV